MTFISELILPQAVVDEAEKFLQRNSDIRFSEDYRQAYTVIYPDNYSMRIEIGRDINSHIPRVEYSIYDSRGSVVAKAISPRITGPIRLDSGEDSYVVHIFRASTPIQRAPIVLDCK